MQNNNIADMRLALLPIEELERMLRTETEKEVPDDDLVLQLLHILEKQGPDTIIPRGSRAEQEYRTRVNARAKRKLIPWMRLVQAASVLLVAGLLLMTFSQQARAESLWERIARWTDKFFSVEVSNPAIPADEVYTFQTENEGLQQVYDAVVELGITDPVVPTWLPEGYELVKYSAKELSQKSYVSAVFSDGRKSVVLNYVVNATDRTNQYPKDKTEVNRIEMFGDEFDILLNKGVYVAVWAKGNTENYLTIDCQEDTLLKVLESIYVWGDNS